MFKIDDIGLLWIQRKNKVIQQSCPIQQDDVKCGDWCAMFDDSELDQGLDEPCLRLQCTGHKITGPFTDER